MASSSVYNKTSKQCPKARQLKDDGVLCTKESWERGIPIENSVQTESCGAKGKESMNGGHLSDARDHTKDNSGRARPSVSLESGAQGP